MIVMKDKDFTGLAKEIQVTKQQKLGAVMLILLWWRCIFQACCRMG